MPLAHIVSHSCETNKVIQAYVSRKHEEDKVIAFERAGLLFIFNFHPTKSFSDYTIGTHNPGEYRVVLDSDDKKFLGHGRIQHQTSYFTAPGDYDGCAHHLKVCSKINLVCELQMVAPLTQFSFIFLLDVTLLSHRCIVLLVLSLFFAPRIVLSGRRMICKSLINISGTKCKGMC